MLKLSPEAKLPMTLGKPGVAGDGPDTFNAPPDVVVAPNGDVFVADRHGAKTNARIVKRRMGAIRPAFSGWRVGRSLNAQCAIHRYSISSVRQGRDAWDIGQRRSHRHGMLLMTHRYGGGGG